MSSPTTAHAARLAPHEAAPAIPSPLATFGALIAHSLRLQRRAILIWGLALGALTAMVVSAYPSLGPQLDEMMANYPPEMLAFFGEVTSMSTIEGFLALEVYNLMAPLALAFYAIILGARAIAGAEERGTLDLFLGNPLPRWQLVANGFATIAGALAGSAAVLGLCTWIPALLAGVDLPFGSVVAAALNLLPLCLFFGGLALLTSALVHRAALAIALPGAVLVAMYVVNALAGLSEAMEPLRPLSIFKHYGSAIENGIAWPSFIVITLIGAAFAGLAAVVFAKRDIYT
jgi:ABC-2 type transport system permease protein